MPPAVACLLRSRHGGVDALSAANQRGSGVEEDRHLLNASRRERFQTAGHDRLVPFARDPNGDRDRSPTTAVRRVPEGIELATPRATAGRDPDSPRGTGAAARPRPAAGTSDRVAASRS